MRCGVATSNIWNMGESVSDQLFALQRKEVGRVGEPIRHLRQMKLITACGCYLDHNSNLLKKFIFN